MNDNMVLPFQLESSRIRGRIVRLGSVMDEILTAHKYPPSVAKLTAETLILCPLLSSMLKYEGVFTLQAQGDGAIKMLVADMVTGGGMRACATFHEDRLKESEAKYPAALLGSGYVAFTVDQGEHMDRYQGIVELRSDLVGSVQHYFTQSEQIMTGLVVKADVIEGRWRGCGIMVQRMPEDSATYNKDHSDVDEDDWRRTMILLGSVKGEEMLSPTLDAQELLFRLFHEEGVRIFDPQPLSRTCRCNPDRVRGILSTMSAEDIRDITVDGKIVMTCEFCSTDYVFNPDELKEGIST